MSCVGFPKHHRQKQCSDHGTTDFPFAFYFPSKGEAQMSPRPPTTYLTADELKQIAAIKFVEAMTAPVTAHLQTAKCHQGFGEMKGYLASKELEPPK
jgi:hypothetical protein